MGRDNFNPQEAYFVGEFIKKLRGWSELHQSDILEYLGMSKLVLSTIESGRSIRADNAFKILSLLVVTPGDGNDFLLLTTSVPVLGRILEQEMDNYNLTREGGVLEVLQILAEAYKGQGGQGGGSGRSKRRKIQEEVLDSLADSTEMERRVAGVRREHPTLGQALDLLAEDLQERSWQLYGIHSSADGAPTADGPDVRRGVQGYLESRDS